VRPFDRAERPDETDVDAGLLLDLPDSRLLDLLPRLDAAAGNDCAELRLLRKVEDEELVEARDGVLARDVDGDGRAGSQLDCARILAL
jgi:hypothetical protein